MSKEESIRKKVRKEESKEES